MQSRRPLSLSRSLKLLLFSNFSYKRRSWLLIKWLCYFLTPTISTPKPRSLSMILEESSKHLVSNLKSQRCLLATLSNLLVKARLSSMSHSRHKEAKSCQSCRNLSVRTICTAAKVMPMIMTLTSYKRNT